MSLEIEDDVEEDDVEEMEELSFPTKPVVPQKDETFIDFEADAKPKPLSTQDLSNITTLAKRLLHFHKAADFYEAKLREAKDEVNKLEGGEIPELMQSVGLKQFKLATGEEILIKEIVSGSITEPKREKALAWLKENGHQGIIKHMFSVDLPKNAIKDVKKASELKAKLEALGMAVEDKETVHPQTLCAWAREMLGTPETANIPLDILGIYVGKRATVKQPAKTSD